MPQTVCVKQDINIIEVRSYGEITERELINSRESVARICAEQGINKVLIDARKDIALPPSLPLYEFNGKFSRHAMLQNMKIAIVIASTAPDDIHRTETAANNRGVQAKAFDSVHHALSWLAQ